MVLPRRLVARDSPWDLKASREVATMSLLRPALLPPCDLWRAAPSGLA